MAIENNSVVPDLAQRNLEREILAIFNCGNQP
ncbi:MAG: hypothetical protein ACJA0Q_001963 [Saprospiraceae bacterium]|jgi:hypothetical protein